MGLSSDKLETEFRKVIDPLHPNFVNFSSDPDIAVRRIDAAEKWATAFDNYGQDVENVNEDDFLSTPNKAGFKSALSFATTTPAQLAAEFGAAWTAYWTGLTFQLGTPGPINASGECPNVGGNLIFGVILSSVVTAVVPASLIAALTAIFLVRNADPESKASELADAFHVASVGNVVVLTSGMDTTPPAAGPLPITNTCRLF